VELPQEKVKRVKAPTHEGTSKDGRKHTRDDGRLMHDTRENVGEPTSHCRQRRSPDR